MKIYAYLFILAVGLFMMTAAMCNKETPKPARPVFEADTTGGTNNPNPNNPTTPPPPAKAKVTIFVDHVIQQSQPVEGAEVTLGMAKDTAAILAGNPPLGIKTTGADGKVVFGDLPPGTYFIFGEVAAGGGTHDNYNNGFKDPRIIKAGDNYQEITLEPR